MSLILSTEIGSNVCWGDNVYVGKNCVIEDNVTLGDNVYIDANTIIRSNVSLGEGTFVGSNCIIGEYLYDFCLRRTEYINPKLVIGVGSLIRSGSIIYAGSTIGCGFQTGHQVNIREKSIIGDYVSIGTLSDIQGNCEIGNYVRMHSNVHIGQLSKIDSFVWIYPYVILTNDPTPPSNHFIGVHVNSFAVIATGSIVLPGLEIGHDALVAAGAIVTKSVEEYAVVGGNPAKTISDVRKVKNHFTGEKAYPWRNKFENYMPWVGVGFTEWYLNLSQEEKKKYGMEAIDIE